MTDKPDDTEIPLPELHVEQTPPCDHLDATAT